MKVKKHLVFMMLAVFLFTSANLQAATKPVTLKFWFGMQTPERNEFMKGLLKEFEAKNPGIKVEYLGIPGDPSAYKQKLDISVAAGDEPDVSMNFFPDYISRGVYLPLDPYFNKWADRNKLQPAAIASNRSMDVKKQQLYAIPYASVVRVFWVRSDWYKEAGLPIFQTWDQFFNSVPKLTDKSKGRYGTSIRGGGAAAENLEMLMYSYSGITDYFDKNGKCTVNDPLHVQFVEKYLALYDVYTPEDDLTKGWVALAATFQSGKAASIFHNLGSASSHRDAFNGDILKFQAVNLPKGVKGYRVHPNIKPHGYSIHQSSSHKDEAWRLITYLLSKDALSKFGKEYGEIPLNKDTADDSWLHEVPWFATGAELFNSPDTQFYTPPYHLPEWSLALSRELDPMVQQVMAKQMTAKQMLDEWARIMEKAQAKLNTSLKK